MDTGLIFYRQWIAMQEMIKNRGSYYDTEPENDLRTFYDWYCEEIDRDALQQGERNVTRLKGYLMRRMYENYDQVSEEVRDRWGKQWDKSQAVLNQWTPSCALLNVGSWCFCRLCTEPGE